MSVPVPVSFPVLELENVSAAYSTYRALFGVSLMIPQNGIVALVGSNGAGKSTLARVVSGLVPAAGGSVRFEGEDVTRWPAHRIARAGMVHVPEGRAIFSSLSVEENLTVSFSRRIGRKADAGGPGARLSGLPRPRRASEATGGHAVGRSATDLVAGQGAGRATEAAHRGRALPRTGSGDRRPGL